MVSELKLVIRNETRGGVLAERAFRAAGFLERGLGLLARPPLRQGEALWLDPCGGVHTCGMRYSIDVVFLDRSLRVTGIARAVRPWRIALAPRGTRSVLELPSGGAAGLERGDRVAPEEGRSGPAEAR